MLEDENYKILFITTHEDPAGKEEVKKGPENASCPLYEKGCNNMLCPMLSESGIWYA
ncbi:hypothetical protein [Ferroplasma acidiphilum]|uniref:hypothetical protein n=1 Tax=Ferroplasma acidiphilum TaxID=74969 RepID=UPI0028165163|nr:hypothetical protein [Ferroplasma acidiphilum]WMT52311.1 MAG: hypothetical protein RE473_04675 [Ferroplasma acidiphilum]